MGRVEPALLQLACRSGFTMVEMLVVVGIVVVLVSLLFPIISSLGESSRRQQAAQTVAHLTDALREYASEDPTRSFPVQEADLFIREDPNASSFHLINALTQMQSEGGLQKLVRDQANNGTLVLVDPWKRPYRYQLDNAGSATPNVSVNPTRPDPAKLDWNARNLVPFGYVWSLGSPLHGSSGLWYDDPDAVAGTGAPWIYSKTSVEKPSP